MTEIVRRATGARYTLFLLFLANLLNVADRALLGIVVDPVKADLALSDTQMSIVSGFAFVTFNLVMGIFIAHWVDHGNRKLILTLGVALWSAATAMTGLAQGFTSLTLARILVGVGEATAFPVAYSMIADLFAAPRRPRAVAIFQASTFVGLIAGSILAGVIAAAHGWRTMFVTCGLAGFVLVALLLVTMREPQRIEGGAVLHRRSEGGIAGSILHLARLPGFVALSFGTAFATMVGGVMPTWAPAFFLRSHDVPLAAVGALIGPAVGGGGIAGTLVSGILATRLARGRDSEVPGMLVPLVALPLAVPFLAIFTFAPSLTLTMIAAAIMNFLLGMAVGPCIAVAIGVAPPRMRALASTLVLVGTGLIGSALAPAIVGIISDALQPRFGANSLRYGIAAIIPTPIIAALFLRRAYAQLRS
ncbi:spinster family MFS transporter [Sphingomonas sp. MMS24-J13]|uniref:spinster family MFS transporter n=1 Tax=Sphingomonas sp. MMS24-J13 TaxID=3238686 RepID=UPI00384DA29F